MKFNEAAKIISGLPRGLSVLLLGPPGIGKSTLAELIAQMDREQVAATSGIKPDKVDSYVKVCDLACYLPEDLLGVPFKEDMVIAGQDSIVTRHAPPSWIGEMSVPNRNGLLLLDDIGAAAKSVQVAAFRIVQERMSGDFKLSDNVRIICTSNRREDKSGASTLPSALLNRMVIFEIKPDLEDWTKWYHQKGYPSEIAAFLNYRPGHFSKLPKEADEHGAFATPRSWEKLAQCFPIAKKQESLLEVARGLVGEGVAIEFYAFTNTVDDLPAPQDILENPTRALPKVPNEPDKMIALVTGIAEVAAKNPTVDMTRKYVFALAHVCQKSFEYVGHSLTTYVNRAGQEQMSDLVRIVGQNKKHKAVGTLMDHLKKALKSE